MHIYSAISFHRGKKINLCELEITGRYQKRNDGVGQKTLYIHMSYVIHTTTENYQMDPGLFTFVSVCVYEGRKLKTNIRITFFFNRDLEYLLKLFTILGP